VVSGEFVPLVVQKMAIQFWIFCLKSVLERTRVISDEFGLLVGEKIPTEIFTTTVDKINKNLKKMGWGTGNYTLQKKNALTSD